MAFGDCLVSLLVTHNGNYNGRQTTRYGLTVFYLLSHNVQCAQS